jgi:Lrp/AsnC family leucine-responsive transcriptional regulator
MKIDRFDARIVAELQKDGRRSVVSLAEQIGLSGTPCARRIRQLEETGVIRGYTAIVDPAHVGLKVSAFVQLRLAPHADEHVVRLQDALSGMDEVVSCSAITGEYDFLLQVVATDLDALSALVLKKLLKIPGVRDVRSNIVLATIKRSLGVPLRQLGG